MYALSLVHIRAAQNSCKIMLLLFVRTLVAVAQMFHAKRITSLPPAAMYTIACCVEYQSARGQFIHCHGRREADCRAVSVSDSDAADDIIETGSFRLTCDGQYLLRSEDVATRTCL